MVQRGAVDLPPEEWLTGGRSGSMLSAVPAQCLRLTSPRCGSRLLYLHATSGVTTEPHTEHQIRPTAVKHQQPLR
ncbi:hypothetical protein CesoFtcFv8_003351 [Champsocephalus esox]|uniref:Uncharacterized protein n=1 Tax=Champsocephalus esox TaxID=159716 RepID=A0AAN8CTP0_9TELE|nr:hypothetical protein CesoFtcFv8_003351 [Champsocephalus esox]